MDLTCFPAHLTDAQLDWDLMKVSPTVPKQFVKQATAISKYNYDDGVYLVCRNVYVGGTCQSNLHKNAET